MIRQTDSNHKFETRPTHFEAVGQLLSIRLFPTICLGCCGFVIHSLAWPTKRRRLHMSPIVRKLEKDNFCMLLCLGAYLTCKLQNLLF